MGPTWMRTWEGVHLRCILVLPSSRLYMVSSSPLSNCLFRSKGLVQVSLPLRRRLLHRTMGNSLSSIRSRCTLILQVMVVKVYNNSPRSSNRTLPELSSKYRHQAIRSNRNSKDGQRQACLMHRMELLPPPSADPS
jgi:hypothetical protein